MEEMIDTLLLGAYFVTRIFIALNIAKEGSIISVVGTSPAEVIGLFEYTQKAHMTYNEKRPNHH